MYIDSISIVPDGAQQKSRFNKEVTTMLKVYFGEFSSARLQRLQYLGYVLLYPAMKTDQETLSVFGVRARLTF